LTVVAPTSRAPRNRNGVDLIRIIGAASSENGVRPCLLCDFGQDLRGRIGQGEDQRSVRHFPNHVRTEDVGRGEAEKDICIRYRIIQSSQVGPPGVTSLVRVHVLRTAFIDHAVEINQGYVRGGKSHFHEEIEAGETCRAAARRYETYVFDVLVYQLEAVPDCSGAHDGGPMLVIVKNRNVHSCAQLLLNFEAFRRLYILEIDAAECRLEAHDDLDQHVRVLLVNLEVKHVYAGEPLENDRLTFHDGFCGKRTDIPEAEHGCTVRNYGHEVRARRIKRGVGGVRLDAQARVSHPGRICLCEIQLICQRLRGNDLELAGCREAVVPEGALLEWIRHSRSLA